MHHRIVHPERAGTACVFQQIITSSTSSANDAFNSARGGRSLATLASTIIPCRLAIRLHGDLMSISICFMVASRTAKIPNTF
ncbi:MAG: hypothetical protein H6575_00575 [Lewinellaceae bacterium]|nr:hypothetical protein [Lewinellaceae bacterium]